MDSGRVSRIWLPTNGDHPALQGWSVPSSSKNRPLEDEERQLERLQWRLRVGGRPLGNPPPPPERRSQREEIHGSPHGGGQSPRQENQTWQKEESRFVPQSAPSCEEEEQPPEACPHPPRRIRRRGLCTSGKLVVRLPWAWNKRKRRAGQNLWKRWKTRRTARRISRSPDSCSPNEAIRVGEKILTSSSSKADGFAAHYAKFRKISFSAEERSRIRLAKRTVNSPSANDSTAADFSIVDLNRALEKMKNRGAAGPDEVPPTFLKNLGTHAKTELLRVFSMSFREAVVLQVWRNAVIIPLLKSGKPAGSIESYLPVSLTSCMVKLL